MIVPAFITSAFCPKIRQAEKRLHPKVLSLRLTTVREPHDRMRRTVFESLRDCYTCKFRGFGFVEYVHWNDADNALLEMNGRELAGKTLVLSSMCLLFCWSFFARGL